MRRWAAAGLEVTHRTSFAVGQPPTARRNGYDVVRRGGRYGVFPRVMVNGALHQGRRDALVEIWNGVPWFSPLWCRQPSVTFLHHIHGPMWDQVMPRPLSTVGRLLESRVAPPFYRRRPTLTGSDAVRDELLHLGFPAERVSVVPHGIEPHFQPGGHRSESPVVVSVGRLAPVKRQRELIDAMAVTRARVPTARLRLIGDGPLRDELAAHVDRIGARDWVELVGRVTRDELVAAYQSAWLVASASLAEGWGLTLTEAAACATPAVATDIAGHRSSVVNGETGVLVPVERMGDAMADLLLHTARRERLAAAALSRARTLTWDASAHRILEVLVAEVERRR